MSIQEVRTALKKLKTTSEITVETTNQYSIITIKNYEKYQFNEKQSNNPITNEEQTNDNLLTTTKEENNNKKEIKKT